MQWFKNITSIDELRQKYKELLIKYHPDNNPDTDTTKTMQSINSEYDSLIKSLKGTHTTTNTTDFSEDELKNVLNELIKILGNNQLVQVEIIGRFIWLSGDTYPFRKEFKNLGFKFSSKKKMWYWGQLKSHNRTEYDISYIRNKYGSVVFRDNNRVEPVGIES